MDDMTKVFQGLPGGCPTQPDRMQYAKCRVQNGSEENGYMANRMGGGTGGSGESGERRLQN